MIGTRNTGAFVFDMDGTLVDNMPFHKESWNETLRRYGKSVDINEFLRATTGQHGREIIRDYFDLDVADPNNQRLIDEKEESYRNLYSQQRRLLSGLVELLDYADTAGVALAVATAAPRENVSFILDHFRIRQRFSAVIGAEDVERGKPHPDVFLAAATALQFDPGNCLVFEDALLGVEAARRAGMSCVALTTSLPAEAFSEQSHVIASASTFADLDFAALLRHVAR